MERTWGASCIVGFEKEEIELLLDHLKKAMKMLRFMGFNRKFRGKSRVCIRGETEYQGSIPVYFGIRDKT